MDLLTQPTKSMPESQSAPGDAGADQTEIRVKGKSVSVPSARIENRTVITKGSWLKIATVQDEDMLEGQSVEDPDSFVKQLKRSGLRADIFTFAQKLPLTEPRYSYRVEWDNLAVIPITTFSDWWDKRVESSVRRAVRKATKSGIVVKEVEFDDPFVQGIVNINNETPVRQGKPFWHYQKPFDAVKMENSTYAERNGFLGAYCDGELVGYIRLTYVDNTANIIQILSMMKHADKRPTNALMAKAVELSVEKGLSHLVYCNYVYNDPKSSLTEFKRRNGFEKLLIPRYFIPLTAKGSLALRLGFHQGLMQRLPKPIVTQVLKARSFWYSRKSAEEAQ